MKAIAVLFLADGHIPEEFRSRSSGPSSSLNMVLTSCILAVCYDQVETGVAGVVLVSYR